ncbi:CHASE2 domain-containing protein [Taklimakanibacter lacteus]|uniref:CHASE2 domain-containing protein n=1 Tax=Taklimakanibacter lacteus TaxID=2268456 RepID=UPI000E673760
MVTRRRMTPWSPGSWPRWIWAIITAVLVAVLILLGGGKSITAAYKSLTETDRIIEISAALSGAAENSVPVTLIKIDDETMLRWGNPPITPHAALAQLIRTAEAGGATGIVVDIDLASENTATMADPQLVQAISNSTVTTLPLMFVRSFRAGGVSEDQAGPGPAAANPTPYDGAFAQSGKAIWVSVLTPLSADRIVRRLRLWQTICEGAEGVSYPSPALVVAARFDAQGDRSADLGKFLAAQVDRRCKRLDAQPALWPHRASSDVAIQYMFNAETDEATAKTVAYKGAQVPVFKQISASALVGFDGTQASATGEIHPEAFKDRIVVIGVTHGNSHDIYATPLGSQPGTVILANSIAAASAMADMPEASPLTELLIAIGIFGLLAFFSYKFQLAPAALFAGVATVAAALILSRMFGFDAAIRIIAVTITLFVLHKFIDSSAGVIYDWSHGKGWRSILKPH